MSDQPCAATPLVELLRAVPHDLRAGVEVSPTEWWNIPYGRLMNEAADEIERLEAALAAHRCEQRGACDRTVVPVAVGNREADDMESVNEPIAWMVTNVDGQDAYVTADPTLAAKGQRALPLYTAHPDSYGHWDHAQISELLHSRDVLEKRLRAIVLWLEQNQPDVFKRGIWDAIREECNETD